MKDFLNIKNIDNLAALLKDSSIGMKGVEELLFVMNSVSNIGLNTANLKFDVTLARGLDYYTGCILEVKNQDVKIGSLGGGGRYDDLTSIFGMQDISGVGISFGIDRMYFQKILEYLIRLCLSILEIKKHNFVCQF